jgi:hypothetical protein
VGLKVPSVLSLTAVKRLCKLCVVSAPKALGVELVPALPVVDDAGRERIGIAGSIPYGDAAKWPLLSLQVCIIHLTYSLKKQWPVAALPSGMTQVSVALLASEGGSEW